MENDIIDSLSDIKYSGKLNVPENLEKAIKGGSKDVEYTKLVSYLSKELKSLYNLDEEVNPIQTAADSSAFLMELSSFLKEIGCPYESLTTGHLSDRLNNKYDKLLLLDYLLSELMAARMIKFSNPSDDKNELSLTLHETDTARDLKNLLVALQFNKPPPNITAPQLFQKVETKVRDTRSKCKNDLVGKPAFNGHLSEKQWENLSALQQKLHDEYTIRREMLIKRLDVTIQGFQWSERMKGKEATIQDIYKKHAASMTKVPEVDISDLLAARDDITIIEKTSSASVRKNTQTSINKVMIGSVPDRGGRPNEQEPPPPEMPSWQQRNTAGGGRGGGGGGRGGGGRGGGNQGSYAGGNQGGFSAGNQGGYGGGNQGGYGGGSQGGYGGGNQGGYAGGNQGGNRGNQGGHGGGNQGGYGGGNQGGYGSHGGGGGNRGQNYGGNRGGGNYNTYNQPVAGSYADQYVQDSARNQEYSNYNRGGGGGRGGGGSGRSNYNRGGYR